MVWKFSDQDYKVQMDKFLPSIKMKLNYIITGVKPALQAPFIDHANSGGLANRLLAHL